MEGLLDNLLASRVQFFRRWRSENAQRFFLSNETRILTLMESLPIYRLLSLANTTMTVTQLPVETTSALPTQAQISTGTEPPETLPEGVCPICHDPFQTVADTVRLRACRHCFHRQCAADWYALSSRCPICRHDIREQS